MNDSPLVKILLALIPILSATLYMLGLTYHLAYLRAFGLQPILFTIPSDVSILYGFFALFQIGFQAFYIGVLVAISLLFIIIIVVVLSSHTRVIKIHTKVLFYINKFKFSGINNTIVDKSSTAYLYVCGLFLIVLFPYVLAIESAKAGEKLGESNKLKFKSKNANFTMLYITGSSSPIKVQQIVCSTTHCAFWSGKEVITLSHEKIEKVVAYIKTAAN